MSALTIFKGLPSTKQEITDCIEMMYFDIVNGNFQKEELIELAARFKKMEHLSTVLDRKEVKELILNALDDYKVNTVNLYDCAIQKKSAPKMYVYDLCGDPVYNSLKNQSEEISKQLKEREKFLQAIPPEMNIVTEDGEPVTIYRAEIKPNTGNPTYSIRVL